MSISLQLCMIIDTEEITLINLELLSCIYNVSPQSGAQQFDMTTEIPDNCAKNNDTSDQTAYMEYYTRTQDPETEEYTYTNILLITAQSLLIHRN